MPYHRKLSPRKLLDVDFVITVDRSMMTDHHHKEFIGFLTTSPAVIVPERVWLWIACPRIRVDEYGRPYVAPYGLRKVEAALIDAGFKAAIIDPDYIWPYLKRAKALLIGHHDFFGLCPPSSEWWLITNKEPVNRKMFIDLISQPEIWEAKRKYGLKIIIGGPSAWQWLYEPKALEKWPVDTIIEGEGEDAVVEVAEIIMSGGKPPKYISVAAKDAPPLERIPAIKAPSVNGLVEIMRGCPRGCKFCSVTLRPLRHIPLDLIRREIMVNINAGIKQILLHSEDVPLYGAHGVIPNPEAVLKLHEMVQEIRRKNPEVEFGWSHAALATVVVGEEKFKLMKKIADMMIDGDVVRFIGFQTGIETGSPRLAKKIMPAKAAPYPPEKWPEIVEEAFRILADDGYIPAATIILGLPEETPEDVVATAELIERLKPYPSLIVPMFFVPMGRLRDRDWFTKNLLREEHIEVLRLCFHHTSSWGLKIMNKYTRNPALRAAIKGLILAMKIREWYVEKKIVPRIVEALRTERRSSR